MASVVVTGATGFIGLHLVEALVRRGDRVQCLVRGTSNTEKLGELDVKLSPLDFEHPGSLRAAMADADLVYHVAGVTRSSDRRKLFAVNEQYARGLAAACAEQARPPRLVVVSSVAAAGPGRLGQLRVESDPPSPVSHYGHSKLAGDRAAEQFADKVPLTIIRPGIVFGPRDSNCLTIFQTIKYLNTHFSPGWASPALSLIHVEDLVELLLLAGVHNGKAPVGASGQAARRLYFAVAPEYPTYADFGRIVRPMLHRPWAQIVPIFSPLAWCVAGVAEGISLVRGRDDMLNFDKMREGLAVNWACSGEAAERELGFRPAKPLAERLRETIDWYRSAGWL